MTTHVKIVDAFAVKRLDYGSGYGWTELKVQLACARTL